MTAVAGLVLAQRLIPLSLRERNNTAIGTIYAALYVMFGVSVGFGVGGRIFGLLVRLARPVVGTAWAA